MEETKSFYIEKASLYLKETPSLFQGYSSINLPF